jgi:hypothetical protein
MNLISFEKRTSRFLSAVGALLFFLALFLFNPDPAHAIPAFARKYGLPCSACHIGWPELTNFGQVFKDNGYQMMNDRDSPITRDASYFPATIRITPQWHRESANNQVVDNSPGNPDAGAHSGTLSSTGFDLSGLDMWFAGTLFKNVSFSVLPSSDSTATFHFENAFVRWDNIAHTSWLNLKVGKFELDLPVSEKRLLTMSGNGGFYYIYHFTPVGDANIFGGIGDNQIGVELMGHNSNSYTRYAFSVVSSLDGGVNQAYGETVGFGSSPSDFPPAGRTYDYYGHFEQGFNTFHSGFMKVGAYAYFGFAPTFFETSGGAQFYGRGNKPFYRAGAEWKWYFNKFLFKGVYLHGYDNATLANFGFGTTPPPNPLPAGDRAAVWNGGFLEGQYIISPQWIIIGRYEMIRMSQLPSSAASLGLPDGNVGNLDAFTIANRYYPFMFSRAGLALQQEYSWVRSHGVTNQGGGFGAGCAGANAACNVSSSSIMFGVDFDF